MLPCVCSAASATPSNPSLGPERIGFAPRCTSNPRFTQHTHSTPAVFHFPPARCAALLIQRNRMQRLRGASRPGKRPKVLRSSVGGGFGALGSRVAQRRLCHRYGASDCSRRPSVSDRRAIRPVPVARPEPHSNRVSRLLGNRAVPRPGVSHHAHRCTRLKARRGGWLLRA